eukprot:scaffold53_cov381-Pavlova_lutheri.AAC.10
MPEDATTIEGLQKLTTLLAQLAEQQKQKVNPFYSKGRPAPSNANDPPSHPRPIVGQQVFRKQVRPNVDLAS